MSYKSIPISDWAPKLELLVEPLKTRIGGKLLPQCFSWGAGGQFFNRLLPTMNLIEIDQHEKIALLPPTGTSTWPPKTGSVTLAVRYLTRQLRTRIFSYFVSNPLGQAKQSSTKMFPPTSRALPFTSRRFYRCQAIRYISLWRRLGFLNTDIVPVHPRHSQEQSGA